MTPGTFKYWICDFLDMCISGKACFSICAWNWYYRRIKAGGLDYMVIEGGPLCLFLTKKPKC